MLLIILGAGASHDSNPSYPIDPQRYGLHPQMFLPTPRPPLATELFAPAASDRGELSQFRAARGLLARLRLANLTATRSVEEELELILKEAGHSPNMRRQLVALTFYLRSVVESVTVQWSHQTQGATNYHILANLVDRWRRERDPDIALVTFNYDALLEQALGDCLQMTFDSLDSYVAGTLRVLKPHGSITWRQPVTSKSMNDYLVFSGGGFSEQDYYEWLINSCFDEPLVGTYEVGDLEAWKGPLTQDSAVYMPAIAIPTQTKTQDNFVLPDAQRTVLSDILARVTEVKIIGWRGREGHFWQLWQAAAGEALHTLPMTIVDANQETAMEVSADLAGRYHLDAVHPLDCCGFSDYMAHSELFFADGPES